MKLFKKAMAIAMAGVLALSMVACAPKAPVDPGKDPSTDVPVNGTQQNVIDIMNYYRTKTYLQYESVQVSADKNHEALFAAIERLLKADPNKDLMHAIWTDADYIGVDVQDIATILNMQSKPEALADLLGATDLTKPGATTLYMVGDDAFVPVELKEFTETSESSAKVIGIAIPRANLDKVMKAKAKQVLAYVGQQIPVEKACTASAAEISIPAGKVTLVWTDAVKVDGTTAVKLDQVVVPNSWDISAAVTNP